MTALSKFIESFPPDSPEREYHATLEKIVSTIEFDRTNPAVGIGLLKFLTDGPPFIALGVDTCVHPIANFREANALFVMHLFDNLRHNAAWWRYESLLTNTPWTDWWEERFRQSKLVDTVFD